MAREVLSGCRLERDNQIACKSSAFLLLSITSQSSKSCLWYQKEGMGPGLPVDRYFAHESVGFSMSDCAGTFATTAHSANT